MQILLLSQVAPYPPDAGPKIKTYYLLRKLSEFHDIELVTFARDEREQEAAHHLRSICSRVTTVPLRRRKTREPFYAAKGWATRTPFLIARDYRAAMASTIQQRLESGQVDVIHADQLSMAQYLANSHRAMAVFDAHNAVWKLVQSLVHSQPTPAHRAAASLEWRLLRRFEGHVSARSDLTLAVSEIDAQHLADAAGAPVNFAIAPIGIEARDAPLSQPNPDSLRLLSVATMHYPPNADALRWFRDSVWPRLHEDDRTAGLDIVGSRPPADLTTWSDADQNVRVHGYVEDLASFFRHAGVFIVPLRAGSGIRVKILEAMARGLPVVSTSIGIEGLPVQPGKHLMVADSAETFAESVRILLRDSDRRRMMAEAARSFALRYDWRICLQPIIDAYSQLDAAGRPHRHLDPAYRLQAHHS